LSDERSFSSRRWSAGLGSGSDRDPGQRGVRHAGLAIVASAALTDSGPYPHLGWLAEGFYAKAALGVSAVALLVVGRVSARGQHLATRLGWVVAALSVASLAITTLLGRPA